MKGSAAKPDQLKDRLKLFLLTIVVGVGVALTYHVFETVVRNSIDYIWYDWLNTDDRRWLVVPTAVILALVFFGVQHLLDGKSESHESQGLGGMPSPTLTNFAKILAIGFLSLVAGASLGPEAILVPSCMVLGGYVGAKAYKSRDDMVKTLAMAGFIALFAAFFHSFVVGLLSILLVMKQAKVKFSVGLLVLGVLAAGSCALMVNALSAPEYFSFPSYTWKLTFENILVIVLLAIAGGLATYGIGFAHSNFEKLKKIIVKKDWWYKALVAALGISLLYLLGGPLVEFTGNKSIQPMFEQAASLGLIGLLWIFVVKICAISWSKAMGYRGGMIFPTIFLASLLVAIVQVFFKDANFIYGLIAAIAGAIAADSKVKVLL